MVQALPAERKPPRQVDLRHRPAAKPPKHCEVFQFSPNQVGHGTVPRHVDCQLSIISRYNEAMAMLRPAEGHLHRTPCGKPI
jgi:hypothetical protein